MTSLFVTSSGTEIGKTFVSCRLLEHWRHRRALRATKPIITGFAPEDCASSDTAHLLEAQGLAIDERAIAATSPWRFRAALSPDMAAAAEGRRIPFEELVAFSAAPENIEINLIEGIGGVMAPIGEGRTVLDWLEALEARIVLVTGSYLGSLSHSLTAIDVLQRRGLIPAAIVVSQSETEPVATTETARSLADNCRELPILVLPRNDQQKAAERIAALARLTGVD